jgi:hypothetical protein
MTGIEELLSAQPKASPSPASVDWVPIWNLGAPGGPGPMVAIQDVVLSAAGASIDFTNIPQNFAQLLLMYNATSDQAGDTLVNLAINGDTTAANYEAESTQGQAASTVSTGVSSRSCGILGPTTRPLGCGGYLLIPNYVSAGRKAALGLSYTYRNLMSIGSVWSGVAPITRLTFTPSAGNFVAGSRFTLYGIAATNVAAPAGTVIADQLVTSAVSSIVFDTIPQSFKHLQLEATWMQSATTQGNVVARVNNLATAIYDNQYSYATGAAFTAAEAAAQTSALLQFGYQQNGGCDVKFPNYTNAFLKWLRSSFFADWGGHTNGAGGRNIGEAQSLINLLTAITRIDIISPSTFVAGSRFTLYGIG